MDWTKSYSATWRVYRVNRRTWADAERVTEVDSVSITRTADGSLLESGTMECTGDLAPDYYRVVMTAEQGGDIERVDVATLLFDVTSGIHDHGVNVQSADGYSVLYPASRTAVITGEYAPAGVDGAAYAAELLRKAINAPVEVDGSFVLNEHVVHEIGSTVLDAVWAVLDAGGFVLQIDGRGVVHILAKPTSPSLVVNAGNLRMLSNGVKYTNDMSVIPNRYIVISDSNKTIAVNQDPDSAVSTVVRGYFVDEVDESPTPVNGETLSAYAERRLREKSVMQDEREYIREYSPDVYVYSIVRTSIDSMQGDLRVTSQSISCSHGITLTEKASREVEMW